MSEAQPGTAIRWSMDEHWTGEAHLIANMHETMSGLHKMQQRYARPGVTTVIGQAAPEGMQDMLRPQAAGQAVPFDALPMDEFDRLLAENYALGPSAALSKAKEA